MSESEHKDELERSLEDARPYSLDRLWELYEDLMSDRYSVDIPEDERPSDETLTAHRERIESAVRADERARVLPDRCALCGHADEAHVTTSETDLDGRSIGGPYEYCTECEVDGEVERTHQFSPAARVLGPAADIDAALRRLAVHLRIRHNCDNGDEELRAFAASPVPGPAPTGDEEPR